MKQKLINLLLYKDIHIPRPHVFADLPLKSTAAGRAYRNNFKD
jgi:hypothetical protein